MKGHFRLVLLLLCFGGALTAQEPQTSLHFLSKPAPGWGKVTVNQENTVAWALNHHSLQQSASPGIMGYRINLYSSTNREESIRKRSKFVGLYSEIECYWSFDTPNYKVTCGDFRTRSEALAVLDQIRASFPDAIITTKMQIKYPKL